MITFTTETDQPKRQDEWDLYWFHRSDLDASYPANQETLALAGFVPAGSRINEEIEMVDDLAEALGCMRMNGDTGEYEATKDFDGLCAEVGKLRKKLSAERAGRERLEKQVTDLLGDREELEVLRRRLSAYCKAKDNVATGSNDFCGSCNKLSCICGDPGDMSEKSHEIEQHDSITEARGWAFKAKAEAVWHQNKLGESSPYRLHLNLIHAVEALIDALEKGGGPSGPTQP
jgi:hypothetical protein